MSLFVAHMQRTLAQKTAVTVSTKAHGVPGGRVSPSPSPSARPPLARPDAATNAARLMRARLKHDLLALKQIKSTDRKVAAKRKMLPEYADWVAGLLAAGLPGEGDDILPTMMVWQIDVRDWNAAMPLVRHVLRHNIAMPARYERDAPSWIAEEIAEAAIAAQQLGQTFPIEILLEVEELTGHADMHDPIKAKLAKAIGTALAEEVANAADAGELRARAIAALTEAQRLNPRAGVATRLRQLTKAEEAASKPASQQTAPTRSRSKAAKSG